MGDVEPVQSCWVGKFYSPSSDSMLSVLDCSWQVIAFVMDNATNNDTMMSAIEKCCDEADVYFLAKESWMCCMPHTVHLAAIKVVSMSYP
jgi:hypothetical protein